MIVAGKDVKEVDNDYFLIPVKIMDHEGPLKTNFAIENRLLPQGALRLLDDTFCHAVFARSYSRVHTQLMFNAHQKHCSFHLQSIPADRAQGCFC